MSDKTIPTSGSEAGGEAVWQDIKTAPHSRSVLVKFPSGEVEVCYKTDPEPPFAQTWRYSFAKRGLQAPWPVEWCEIPEADAKPALANPAPAAGDVREAFRSGLEAAAQYIEDCGEYGFKLVAEAIRAINPPAALSAPASAPGSGVAAGAQRQVRHLKRGSTYHVLGEAEVQISVTRPQDHGGRLIEEGDRLTVYRCRETGKLWARFPDEFNDGRFQEIA